jgi:hypothetical protein
MKYIAVIHKDPKSDFRMSFPDFPGCITAGGTSEEAKLTAIEALEGVSRRCERWASRFRRRRLSMRCLPMPISPTARPLSWSRPGNRSRHAGDLEPHSRLRGNHKIAARLCYARRQYRRRKGARMNAEARTNCGRARKLSATSERNLVADLL